MEGADYARIFLQNDPRSFVKISKTRDFWMTRLKSTACSAAWAVQWEVGPFSEPLSATRAVGSMFRAAERLSHA